MSVIEALHNRNSHPRLVERGPSTADLDAILTAGLRAPDHGRLRPWEFLVVAGDRRVELGNLFQQALLLTKPDASEAELTKASNAPLRAPLLIAGLLKPQDHPKIPRVEQVAAVAHSERPDIPVLHRDTCRSPW